jgi:hypothetical protein
MIGWKLNYTITVNNLIVGPKNSLLVEVNELLFFQPKYKI